ncbi:AAA family ATPase [Rhizobium sp. VS19-DR104.2]|uniref:AAA family ATPase n=1 Tax=unclassified Rhizobium TaxID=2613769 RepID=UPI001CC41DA8|nr:MULTISPECIES: ATP-binding protein [unclassified Rhizobium]MBZ5761782.1 AAA family ATPase [Rhizobium sp. VS19-DR96]MBZ5768024.1 AAA family ATPase [Rhizobium sp. VS19-DR129.2]MBZ5775372.1 AAA family ATPase [Rhizobium sp. VS19-DRK62.2]MBZ5786661.1 AAA family ATPase [Rhizobium sp. VS19-DR121]MBZ5803817.1 AAA family ATPase [Rhizobium sp. VS19-DR181]
MKIKSVELIGHPGIGNLFVSFVDDDSNTFNTVVLAGENGTGKTALLDAIQNVMEGNLGGDIGVIKLELHFDDDDRAALSLSDPLLPSLLHVQTVKLIKDTSVTHDWGAYQLEWVTSNHAKYSQSAKVHEVAWRRHFRSFYNEARVEYAARTPGSVTGLQIDTPDITSIRSGANSDIVQLLVDIRAADAEDLAMWVHNNPGVAPPSDVQNIRFSRFQNAFDEMFPAKRFKGVTREDGTLRMSFEEYGRVSSIDHLSTGEKQILFRAGFVLRNLEAVLKGIFLIDEPELSLHPDWQARILPFYTKILSDPSGAHPQIIVSTHSPFIVHGAANAKIVILEKDQTSGFVRQMSEPVYPGLKAPFSVRAFNIDAFLESSKKPLLVMTEGETDAVILETAWRKLFPTKPIMFELRPALGVRNLNITLNDAELGIKLGSRGIVGIYDFDDAYNQWKGTFKKAEEVSGVEEDGLVRKHPECKAWAMLLPVPAFRSKAASREIAGNSTLSIEFMFPDECFPKGFVKYELLTEGQRKPFISNGKAEFAESIMNLQPSAFNAFLPLFRRLEEMIGGKLGG